MARKARGYSHAFRSTSAKRVSIAVDRVPPQLKRRAQAKCRRQGVSLRSLILDGLQRWVDAPDEDAPLDVAVTSDALTAR